jgi:LPS sulfotransferase NodH
MPDPRPILCIVAGQRSGSTALRTALLGTRFFKSFREIFQYGTAEQPGSFRQFAESRSLPLADMTSHSRARSIIQDFLDHLVVEAGEKIPVIDIKQNSWNALRPFWGYSQDEPLLMEQLRRRGARFIFLARRDLTAQIVSEQIAQATGLWHNLTEGDVTAPVAVDPVQALRQARQIIENEKLLLGHLQASNRLLAIWYEDLFEQGKLSAVVASWLNRQLGIQLPPWVAPKISRNEVSKPRVVSNYGELQVAIDGLIKQLGRAEFPPSPVADDLAAAPLPRRRLKPPASLP